LKKSIVRAIALTTKFLSDQITTQNASLIELLKNSQSEINRLDTSLQQNEENSLIQISMLQEKTRELLKEVLKKREIQEQRIRNSTKKRKIFES